MAVMTEELLILLILLAIVNLNLKTCLLDSPENVSECLEQRGYVNVIFSPVRFLTSK